MLRIGLTGGIGSGKSTVSRMFAVLGAPVYDSDSAAKRLMGSSPDLISRIVGLFGREAYRGGILDRAYLAARVFADKDSLRELNAVVHPAVAADFRKWASDREAEGCPYIIHESAILFESGLGGAMDYTVTVSAPVEVRVGRAVLRDATDPEKVRARIANQMDDTERESLADYVIRSGEGDILMPQVMELDKIFRA